MIGLCKSCGIHIRVSVCVIYLRNFKMIEERRKSIWLYAMLGSSLMLPIVSMVSSLYCQYDLWWFPFLHLLGCIFGSVIAGLSAHHFSRKDSIWVEGLIFTVTFISSCFPYNNIARSIASFLLGICFSGMPIVLVVYFVEIGQWHNTSTFCGSLFLFYKIGFILPLLFYGTGLLIYRIAIQLIFSVLLLLFYLRAPETPQYLMSRSAWEEAEISAVISAKKSFKAWFFVILIFICINLSGISLALQVAIYKMHTDYYVLILGISGWAIMGSLITFLFVDRIGRNKILITSTLGLLTCQLLVASFVYTKILEEWSWLLTITITMLYCFCNIGYADIPLIVCAEVMLSNKKALILSLTSALGWLINLLGFLLYDYLVRDVEFDFFWLFPTVNLLGLMYYGVYIPETVWTSVKDFNETFKKK